MGWGWTGVGDCTMGCRGSRWADCGGECRRPGEHVQGDSPIDGLFRAMIRYEFKLIKGIPMNALSKTTKLGFFLWAITIVSIAHIAKAQELPSDYQQVLKIVGKA